MRSILQPAAVLSCLKSGSKKQVLLDLAQKAGELLQIDSHMVFNVLWEREKLGTTGVGHGIAIPHGRIEQVNMVHGFFARLEPAVSFDALDDKPVDLVFMLLAPTAAGADHLQALGLVSKLFRDGELCKKLRESRDDRELYQLITAGPSARAA